MRHNLGLAAMVGLAVLAACEPVAAGQAPLPTAEVGEALRMIARRCPADLAKAIDGAVHDLNAMPERSRAAPVAPVDASATAFLAAYAGMGEDPASPQDEAALRKVAIEGMIRGFGPDATYVDFDDAAGGPAAVYVELRQKSPDTILVEPMEGGPAEKAGVLSGDRLVSVDGHPTVGLSVKDVRLLLRGEVGAPARLVVARSDHEAPLTIDIERINDPSLYRRYNVRSKTVAGVGVVAVAALDNGTVGLVKEHLRALQAQRPAPVGYVLDLRANSGGLLEEVVALADLFMDKGVVGRIASVGACPPEPAQVLQTRRGDETHGAPLVVLVDAQTASGAELLASGLVQAGRATVLGERTFGAGQIRSVFPVAGTRAMVLPSGEFLAKDGARLQGVGVTPSILVPARTGTSDPPLDRAMAILQAGVKP